MRYNTFCGPDTGPASNISKLEIHKYNIGITDVGSAPSSSVYRNRTSEISNPGRTNSVFPMALVCTTV